MPETPLACRAPRPPRTRRPFDLRHLGARTKKSPRRRDPSL